MKTPLVSIILLNYNNLEFNTNCIRSLLAQTYKELEIIFVNNLSTDGSLEEVESIFEKEIASGQIIIAQPTHNLWFAWGNNFAMDFVSDESDYICLLNNDTTLPIDRLDELVKGLQSNDELGWVGSLILDRGYEDDIKEFVQDRKIIANLFCDSVFHHLTESEKKSTIHYTSILSGCCFLYKKEIIWKPFLNEYFAYGEDVWLSLNILTKWYKLALVTSSTVNHFGSASFGKKPSLLKSFHGSKNQLCNFLFFHKGLQLRLLVPWFIFIQMSQLFLWWFTIRLKWKRKALTRVIQNRSRIQQQKHLIRSQKKTSNAAFYSQLSYKFTDEIYYAHFSRTQKALINFINLAIYYYLKLFRIKFEA